MPIDPVDAALDAVAAHFAAVAGIGAAYRGWPEHPEPLDFTGGPVVTVTATSEERQWIPPTPLDDGPDVTYQVAELTLRAQLDLWAPYRAQRDDAAELVERALHNDLPLRAGLFLDSTGYHDRPLDVHAGLGRNVDSEDGVALGEWRRTWELEITTDVVVVAATPQQLAIELRTTTTPTGVTDTTTVS